jgi:sugar-specific transcriptional regulator TrmB
MKTRKETKPARSSEVLERLGFTPLESTIYAFLAGAGPATGYRIAQAVGKPVGNVYKAVEALEDKGAVMTSEEDATRLVRVVAVQEVVARLRGELSAACDEAVRALEVTHEEVADDHVYRLTHTSQFLRRAASMLESASQFVIMTATPGVLGQVVGDAGETFAMSIREHAKRVPIAAKVYGHVDLPGVEVVEDPRGTAAVESGPGEWIVMTVDGREVLTGLFDRSSGELLMGQWTENPLLAWAMYTGLSSDLALAALRIAAGDAGAAKLPVTEILKLNAARFSPFESAKSAGKLRLQQRFRSPARGKRADR